ncbi:CynX/NimT family MFS transporter [Negadavirga shengliensis]|uniref:CynX/NimT family MFS transporter n=1 Tax=Negadavirga shengliensis TaxID=1389218 RepID=A0ABV9SVX7_9BACT
MPKNAIRDKSWFLVLGILLVSFNLRPSFTAVGPLIPYIRTDLGLSHGWAGFLTTLPLLTFATFSLFSAAIGRRLGQARAILFGLIILLAGTVARVMGGAPLLYFGTALTGTGIVICNVLIIPLVKSRMPAKTGWVTGMFTTGMSMMAAIATAFSVPMAQDLGWGWRGSLLFWALLILLTAVFWVPQIKKKKENQKVSSEKSSDVWKSPLAWQVSLYMGVQSLLFYTLITWLPDMLIQKGLSSVEAGVALSVMQVVGLMGTLLSPIIALRFRQQSGINLVLGLAYLLGFSALFSSSIALNLLGIGLVGVCMGASISLAYTLMSLRTSNETHTAGLSGMAQSTGYYLAALGPLLFGLAYDIWQDWNMLIYLMLVFSGLFTVFGWLAGRERTI